MTPVPPAVDDDRTELLGSLTTQQQQRTSARVIKKLMLEPQTNTDRDKRDVTECETPSKIDDKDPLKFPTVKQRMPKALWSAEEKSYFFEALNEYSKDFDAITSYICAKMKKKGMPDSNLKTKTQVSHFYYRTWHKLSKHVHFDENVKKVAQELYALINYGELRRKLASVNEKTCARLGEMVRCGSIAVRARGRTVRVRTPMCRALRRLNQIAERECGTRVCLRALVLLRARDTCAWARVQAAAHNPRAATSLPLRTSLTALLRALQRRWKTCNYKEPVTENGIDTKIAERLLEHNKYIEEPPAISISHDKNGDLEEHLNLVTDSVIIREHKLPKKLALHVGPRPGSEIHLPVLSPSEQLSSQKICFSSYLERMRSLRRDKDNAVKLRTPKRQRKDSLTDKDKEDNKKFKPEDTEVAKLMQIDETAIDGIELMAHFRNHQEDEEKPSTEDEKDLKSEETAEEEVDRYLPEKDMSEKEKDSFSEMEDDEKFTKSDSDNESDGKTEKNEESKKFKNLKVKFRLRPMKRGRSIYTMVLDKEQIGNAKIDDAKVEEVKVDDEKEKEDTKPDIDVEMAKRQIRKGWSVYDAGDLTIGDLYLMFGSRSKLELDYWWAEPMPPLPQTVKIHNLSESEKSVVKEKGNKTPEKVDSSVEDEREKRESDTDIFSPKNTFSQDSNDGLSGDERKCEQLASPDHKSSSTIKLVNKLVNRPGPSTAPNGYTALNDRLRRLLALAGNVHVAPPTTATCLCGHVCPLQRQSQKQQGAATTRPPDFMAKTNETSSAIFRHPTPIAPKPPAEQCTADARSLNLSDLPPRRRRGGGRPRNDRRVVVQRLLPLLPKLPPSRNLIPLKMLPNSPTGLPKLLPKPPVSSSDMSMYYVISETNGQFFVHDGDSRIPITPQPNTNDCDPNEDKDVITEEDEDSTEEKVEVTETGVEVSRPEQSGNAAAATKLVQRDITTCLPSESMSLSPSRLLRDAEGWLEGSVQDFSLSSFLGHLEGRPQPEMAQCTADARSLNLSDLPPRRRRGGGRPRNDRRVVVQRLLPLLPKLPPSRNLMPLKMLPNSPTGLPRLLPKPPVSSSDMSMYYVISETNGQFFVHDGDSRIPITPQPNTDDCDPNEDKDAKMEEDEDSTEEKVEVPVTGVEESKTDQTDNLTSFLPSESMSLSPSRLLRDAEGWLEGSVQDFSLSSFLGHLEGRPQPEMAVDSQLRSLMAETSIDYVAKFADLAAEVTKEPEQIDHLP